MNNFPLEVSTLQLIFSEEKVKARTPKFILSMVVNRHFWFLDTFSKFKNHQSMSQFITFYKRNYKQF